MITSHWSLSTSNQVSATLRCVDFMPSSAIACCGVEMVYQTGAQAVPVLHGIDLRVNPGDIQLLMGPSGSGKTTLLSIMSGLLTPTRGKVHLLGQEITKMKRKQLAQFRREHIGFIFQGFNLFPALTALENVEVALKMKRNPSPRARREEAADWLDKVGLGHKLHALPRDLSGGQQQRVAIARALVGQPCLIMADEPTAALDSQSGHAVIELLRRLAKEDKITVVMVTHDARIRDVADQVTYLEDGILLRNHPEVAAMTW
ncbi:MAG: ABC transporter ATP-binding protein [Spirulina sp. SIO3F2]|nr:ABC transporter ATP-binding protein [Spirulina sp. SIO3F2]